MLMKDAFPWERDGATKGEGASVLMMEMELLKMAEIDAGMASKLSVIGVRDCVVCPCTVCGLLYLLRLYRSHKLTHCRSGGRRSDTCSGSKRARHRRRHEGSRWTRLRLG